MLCTGIMMEPTVMFAFDGATMMAASGETFASGDIFTDTPKLSMGSFLHVVPVKSGEGWADVAERVCKGCSAPSHKHHWLVAFTAYLNRKSHNSELQTMTVEPKRKLEARSTRRRSRDPPVVAVHDGEHVGDAVRVRVGEIVFAA